MTNDFWKPIAQCPKEAKSKEAGKEYELIAHRAGGIDPINYSF